MSSSQPIEFIKNPNRLRECQRIALEILDEFGLVDESWARERGLVVAPVFGDSLDYAPEQVVRLFEAHTLERIWVVPSPELPSYETWTRLSRLDDDLDSFGYPVSMSADREGLDALYSGLTALGIHHLVIDPQERMAILCTKSDFHLIVASRESIELATGKSIRQIFDEFYRDYLRAFGGPDSDNQSIETDPVFGKYWALATGDEGSRRSLSAQVNEQAQDEKESGAMIPVRQSEQLKKCQDLALSVLDGEGIDVGWARDHNLVVVPVPGTTLSGVPPVTGFGLLEGSLGLGLGKTIVGDEWPPLAKVMQSLNLSRLWAIPAPGLPSYQAWMKRAESPFAAKMFEVPLEFPATGPGFESLQSGPGGSSPSYLIVDPDERFAFKWNAFTDIHLIAAPLHSIEEAFGQPARDLLNEVNAGTLIHGQFSAHAFSQLAEKYRSMFSEHS